jgi:hypothetical protein
MGHGPSGGSSMEKGHPALWMYSKPPEGICFFLWKDLGRGAAWRANREKHCTATTLAAYISEMGRETLLH